MSDTDKVKKEEEFIEGQGLEETNIKILIADDDESLRTTLKLILLEENYDVIVVGDGKEAISVIEKEFVNIAILDYRLPDSNGIELASEIKDINRDIQVIILTGKASVESAVEALKKDVYDYLTKPVNPSRLKEVILGALEKQNLVFKNREYLWYLKKSKIELERLNKFKDGLISMISHDLRSPICSIKGLNQSLLEGFVGQLNDKQKEILQTQNDVVDTMMELINSLLDIRQIQEGKLKMNKKATDLKEEAIKPTIKRLTPQISSKEINVNIKCEEGLPLVDGDPSRLAQVIQNLIQNAIKFTGKNGHIDIIVAKNDEDYLEVTVKDDGIGIDPDSLNTIFEVFYTTATEEDKDKRGPMGRGLGLAICREIIKAHNGEIWAESEGQGKGSKFIFLLPVWEE
ncbi:MAG: response regulator [Elusimicrobia bacterium]|nr:response regulator [Elusimicrobiota bacterium]